MKKEGFKLLSGLGFLAFLALLSCDSQEKRTPKNIESSPSKIKSFNDIGELLKKLSKNGIGKLREWSNPFGSGWGSLTDIYFFGAKENGAGVSNSICYYLDGTSEKAVSLLIVLNINNPKEKSKAINKLTDVFKKTIKSISLDDENEDTTEKVVLKHIKGLKNFNVETDEYIINGISEKSKKETYRLLIKSK